MRSPPVLALALLAGCTRPGVAPAWPGAVCDMRVPDVALEGEPALPWTPPTSRVVVDVRVETGAILAGLERAVPRRVVEQRGLDAGPAGKLDVVVDRGPFSVTLAGDELAIDVDLGGEARVCKPLGAFGCVGWASCSPGAHARAAVRLVLDERLGVPPSHVAIPITRPCTLTALGVDVTERVQREADRRAQAIREGIDRGVPVVAPLARSLWQSLAASVPVGAATCARVRPTGLVQAGPRRDGEALAIGLGVEGEVLVETPCAAAIPAGPFPAPRLDRSIVPGVSLVVPVIASWSEVGRRLARALAHSEVNAGGEVVRITDVHAGPSGKRVRMVVTIAGRTCGALALVGTPEASASGEVRFSDLSPAPGELERVHAAGPGVDVEALAHAIAVKLRLPPSLDVAAVPRRIDRIARQLLPPPGPGDPEVTVAMAEAHVDGADVTADGLAIILRATGSAKVTVR